jgi:hypothetical protein
VERTGAILIEMLGDRGDGRDGMKCEGGEGIVTGMMIGSD